MKVKQTNKYGWVVLDDSNAIVFKFLRNKAVADACIRDVEAYRADPVKFLGKTGDSQTQSERKY